MSGLKSSDLWWLTATIFGTFIYAECVVPYTIAIETPAGVEIEAPDDETLWQNASVMDCDLWLTVIR